MKMKIENDLAVLPSHDKLNVNIRTQYPMLTLYHRKVTTK